MEKRNVVVLYTGCYNEKKRIELYNFDTIDHYMLNGVSYIRVQCDGRFYYFETVITTISEINIYDQKGGK